MNDHSHYGEYAEVRHDHRGEYADERHDHDLDYAGKHHAHFDLERQDEELRKDLGRAEGRIRALEERDELDSALDRIAALEAANTLLADVLRQLADRYTQVCLTGEITDTYRTIAEELAGAFHTLAGALGSRRGES